MWVIMASILSDTGYIGWGLPRSRHQERITDARNVLEEMATGGRQGRHKERLGELASQMQVCPLVKALETGLPQQSCCAQSLAGSR